MLSKCNLVFQKSKTDEDFFNNTHYRAVKKWLIYLGIYPYQETRSRVIYSTVLWTSVISILISEVCHILLAVLYLIHAMYLHELDEIIQSLPPILTIFVCMVKVLNLVIYKHKFRKIFDRIRDGWINSKDEEETRILNDFSARGCNYASAYRNFLIFNYCIFITLPLVNGTLDIVVPLNESRPRNLLFEVYYGVDIDDYFYVIYVSMSWGAFCTIAIIFSVDAMYMIIVHHVCGLFAICGYRIQSLAKSVEVNRLGGMSTEKKLLNEKLRQSIIAHEEVFEFTDYLEKCGRISYLLQIGMNLIALSITGIQAVIKLNELEECIRFVIYVVAQNTHLFYNSFIGQMLIDYSSKLFDEIYSAEWYNIPVEMQKMLIMIQMRSKKPCRLTAGGLYEINLESFATVLKTSMSYFMMFLQVREADMELAE